jgi:predicted hotdog family 3-hydroxylacyl-ACP dehydratase
LHPAALVPHSGAMCLLDRVLASGADFAEAELEVRRDGLFDDGASAPAWLGLEYMAQAAAVWAGLRAHAAGAPAPIGLLLGTRRFTTSVGRLPCGARLRVRAQLLAEGDNGMATFACRVEGAGVLQEAQLSVFRSADPGGLLSSSQEPIS